jgi:nicotinamidase/pyrazinamidase
MSGEGGITDNGAATRAGVDGVLRTGDGLLVVDVQHDFLPGGAVAVREGDALIPILNGYLALWRARGLPVFASRDWHPADHCSFAERGGPWPRHCVAGTHGAAVHPALALPTDAVVVSKGTRTDREAYSAFDGTDLDARLRAAGVRRLFIGGLTTDYCVRYTVDDAIDRGYDAIVLEDAVRAVDTHAGDGARALEAMCARGARLIGREALS